MYTDTLTKPDYRVWEQAHRALLAHLKLCYNTLNEGDDLLADLFRNASKSLGTSTVTTEEITCTNFTDSQVFADALAQCTNNDEVQQSIVAVFDRMTTLLPQGHFDECDAILSNLDVHRVPLRVLLSILKATSRVQRLLPGRPYVLSQTRERIQAERSPEDAEAILTRLR